MKLFQLHSIILGSTLKIKLKTFFKLILKNIYKTNKTFTIHRFTQFVSILCARCVKLLNVEYVMLFII